MTSTPPTDRLPTTPASGSAHDAPRHGAAGGPLRSPVRRHPVVSFFVLTYLLTWSLVPVGSFFTPGPLVAAVVVIALTQGRTGFRQLGRRLVRWRVAPVWWAAAVLVPLGVHALTIGANLGLGAGPPSLAQVSPVSGVLVVLAIRLVNPLDGPLGEEPGWRGFAQPALAQGRSPFRATLLLALLVAGWHLPLWLVPTFGAGPADVVADSAGTVAVTFFYAWLLDRSGSSVLLTLVAHAVEGSLQIEQYWPAGPAAGRTTGLYAAAWCAVAVALLVLERDRWWPSSPLPTTADDARTLQEARRRPRP